MFLFKGHGANAVLSNDKSGYSQRSVVTAEAACGFPKGTYPSEARTGPFDYYFPDAASLPADAAAMTKALDDLGAATIENESPPKNATIAPVHTYFGQFIDHDITANTDRENGLSQIDHTVVEPLARGAVSHNLGNLRFAALDLDSVYGGGFEEGPISEMLRKALRSPGLPAKMEIGIDSNVPGPEAPFAQDPGRDLMRLKRGIDSGQVDLALLKSGPEDILNHFFHDGNPQTPNLSAAIIGDRRNDENLAVAQFHLSILRLHNRIVDVAPADVRSKGREAVFVWAQELTRWTYQWLIRHSYLPSICDADTLKAVEARGPVLYNELIQRHPASGGILPMPLEFSAAAFRFGHSMARANYDWNPIFSAVNDRRASFRDLFFFTGASMPTDRLPSNWPIHWDWFVHTPAGDDERSALKIDTGLNKFLEEMLNEGSGASGVMAHLAKRNLRRAYRLNIPTAQGCLDKLAAMGIDLPALDEDQLLEGHTGDAVKAGGFEKATPLWFYVLKEAEVLSGGDRLGPLGSVLVADTLIGLIHHTPRSYVNAAPGGAGWTPADSVRPSGVEITDMASMMSAALLR